MRNLPGILFALVMGAAIGLYHSYERMNTEQPVRNCACMDKANILGRESINFISQYRAALLADFKIDLVTITIPGQVDIAKEAVREFEAAQVGEFGGRGRGLLLLIAPDSNAVRIEVSQALESIFTDTFVAYIQQRQMAPFFQSKRVTDGITATIELIYSRAAKAQAGEAFDPRQQEGASAGGGAQMAANIGRGYDEGQYQRRTGEVASAGSPQEVVATYLAAMRKRDARPDLAIYSSGSRKMMANWTVTPAQMDNIVQTYASCGTSELKEVDTSHAVLRYAIPERTCSPWFFVREDGAWRLDLTMMQRALRFNTRNQWRLMPGVKHEYERAFADWTFNEHGYPNR